MSADRAPGYGKQVELSGPYACIGGVVVVEVREEDTRGGASGMDSGQLVWEYTTSAHWTVCEVARVTAVRMTVRSFTVPCLSMMTIKGRWIKDCVKRINHSLDSR